MITTIGLDGDDTLWVNEDLFQEMERKFQELFLDHQDTDHLREKLLETERRNLECFGYGAKSFALSMVETAIDLTQGNISAEQIQQILSWAKDLVALKRQPLDQVPETLEVLARDFDLVLITKGDMFEQERKIAGSGLAQWFHGVEILSEKTPNDYRELLASRNVEPHQFIMVGNSIRSDIVPVVEIGARAIHIPYHVTWTHEVVEMPDHVAQRIIQLRGFAELPGTLHEIRNNHT